MLTATEHAAIVAGLNELAMTIDRAMTPEAIDWEKVKQIFATLIQVLGPTILQLLLDFLLTSNAPKKA